MTDPTPLDLDAIEARAAAAVVAPTGQQYDAAVILASDVPALVAAVRDRDARIAALEATVHAKDARITALTEQRDIAVGSVGRMHEQAERLNERHTTCHAERDVALAQVAAVRAEAADNWRSWEREATEHARTLGLIGAPKTGESLNEGEQRRFEAAVERGLRKRAEDQRDAARAQVAAVLALCDETEANYVRVFQTPEQVAAFGPSMPVVQVDVRHIRAAVAAASLTPTRPGDDEVTR